MLLNHVDNVSLVFENLYHNPADNVDIYHCMHITCNFYIGILAGIWPCGVITLLEELYLAESKSQVYGSLHNHIQRNSESLSKLGMLNHDYMIVTVLNAFQWVFRIHLLRRWLPSKEIF